MRPLEFGWYLPTHGDTTAYGLMEAQIAGSSELCDRVVQAAEKATPPPGPPSRHRPWCRHAWADTSRIRAHAWTISP